jgi:hypothetical protein
MVISGQKTTPPLEFMLLDVDSCTSGCYKYSSTYAHTLYFLYRKFFTSWKYYHHHAI